MNVNLAFWRFVRLPLVFLSGFLISALWFIPADKQELIPEQTAIHAAETFVRHVYGENVLNKGQPYYAYLVESIWVVHTQWDSAPNITGRGMEIYVNGNSGAIISHRNNK